jgi:hypothetical protein
MPNANTPNAIDTRFLGLAERLGIPKEDVFDTVCQFVLILSTNQEMPPEKVMAALPKFSAAMEDYLRIIGIMYAAKILTSDMAGEAAG